MNQKERILFELSERKIQLAGGNVSDIRNSYANVKAQRDKAGDAIKSVVNASVGLQQVGNLLSQAAAQFLTDIETFKKTAQNLGLDIPADLKGLEQAVKGDVKTADNLLKSANKVKSAV
jgi:hypothetical protein